MVIRVGRWIACPDIETQFAPDNYMGSHSLLFTYDTYTQTGIMLTFCLSDQWMFQCAIHAGTDMAPWYPGATADRLLRSPLGLEGQSRLRFTRASMTSTTPSSACLSSTANWSGTTTSTTSSARGPTSSPTAAASTPTPRRITCGSSMRMSAAPRSVAPVTSFGGGGLGASIPGNAAAYGVLNYTEFQLSKKSYLSVRNEVWEDQKGERTGFANLYSSHAIGLSHNFNDYVPDPPRIRLLPRLLHTGLRRRQRQWESGSSAWTRQSDSEPQMGRPCRKKPPAREGRCIVLGGLCSSPARSMELSAASVLPPSTESSFSLWSRRTVDICPTRQESAQTACKWRSKSWRRDGLCDCKLHGMAADRLQIT